MSVTFATPLPGIIPKSREGFAHPVYTDLALDLPTSIDNEWGTGRRWINPLGRAAHADLAFSVRGFKTVSFSGSVNLWCPLIGGTDGMFSTDFDFSATLSEMEIAALADAAVADWVSVSKTAEGSILHPSFGGENGLNTLGNTDSRARTAGAFLMWEFPTAVPSPEAVISLGLTVTEAALGAHSVYLVFKNFTMRANAGAARYSESGEWKHPILFECSFSVSIRFGTAAQEAIWIAAAPTLWTGTGPSQNYEGDTTQYDSIAVCNAGYGTPSSDVKATWTGDSGRGPVLADVNLIQSADVPLSKTTSYPDSPGSLVSGVIAISAPLFWAPIPTIDT